MNFKDENRFNFFVINEEETERKSRVVISKSHHKNPSEQNYSHLWYIWQVINEIKHYVNVKPEKTVYYSSNNFSLYLVSRLKDTFDF